MTRARDIADLGQDKATLAGYVDTGVTDTEFDYLDGVTSSIQTQLGTKSPLASPTFTGSITTPEIRSGATLTIDPATVGDNTGLVLLKGNLQVDGTSTTINSTTLTVDDLNLTLASGAADSAAANGAGITIDGASATMLYTHSTTSFDFNKPVNVTGDVRIKGDAGTLNFYRTTSPTDVATIEYNHSDSALKVWAKNKAINFSSADADQDTEHLYIKGTTGEVGIGTGSPSSILNLHNGTGSDGDGARETKLTFSGEKSNGSVKRTGSIRGVHDGTGSDDLGRLEFEPGEAGTKMTIDSSGNVGIGSQSPVSLLHLESDNLTNIDKPLTLRNAGSGSTLANTFTAMKFQVGDANAGPSESGHIGAGQVGESGTWSDDSRMMFWVGNAGPTVSNPKMVIDGSGKVGINATPLTRLHVEDGSAGDISPHSYADTMVVENSDDAGISIYSGTDSVGAIHFGDADSDTAGQIRYTHTSSTDKMDFATNGSICFSLHSNGLIYSTPTYSNGQGGTPRTVSIESSGQIGYSSSGRRFKTNIKNIESTILLNKLRPVNYNFFEKIDGNWSETEANKYFQSGLIAEEVKDALTELGIEENNALFGEDENGTPNYVNYIGLIPYLIKGFQELSAKVTALENA